MHKILIYGAYGYTGQLIVEEAVRNNLKPILGGRNSKKLEAIAQRFQLPFRVFGLEKVEEVDQGLESIDTVLNIAGPYSKTAVPMVKGCLRNQVHYLDVTGEWDVFEWISAKHEAAKRAGIVLLPGTGFDVVPSDCLAAYLHGQLPDAEYLELAFKGIGEMSRGTTLTMLENMHKGGFIRKDGKITKVPFAHSIKQFQFINRYSDAVSIPWGDISTAFQSTQIPNITVYMALPGGYTKMLPIAKYFSSLLGFFPVQEFFKHFIKNSLNGPDEPTRAKGKCYLWGEVRNAKGETRSAQLKTPDGYTLTAQATVLSLLKLMNAPLPAGFYTPSQAFGNDFILAISGTHRFDWG